MGVYQSLGVKTYINAWDTISDWGGSRMPGVVLDAMEAASRDFVEIAELEQKVGTRIAEMTRNEAAFITSSATAAIFLSVAACVGGLDNPKNEIIVLEGQRAGYEVHMQTAGAKVVTVDAGKDGVGKLRDAITPKTCAIFFYDLLRAYETSPSFEDTVQAAKERGIPLIVDAAAQLPPVENLWRFTQGGADAAIFSGGKGLRGPQGSGLIVGKKWLVDAIAAIAPPAHGIGRSAKVGREEIVGLYTALREYLRPGMVEAKIATIQARVRYMGAALEATGLVKCARRYPGPTGQSYPTLSVTLPFDALEVAEQLRALNPGILVGRRGERELMVNPLLLEDDETDAVIRAIVSVITTTNNQNDRRQHT